MAKRIVLFSDGTGNSSASLFKTNVWRIYDALDFAPGVDQVAYYDDGVGSSSDKRVAAVTGAVGIGLKRNVLDLYKFLSRQYADAYEALKREYPKGVPEDKLPKISCFGFSRGAFTLRVLLGLIHSQGLLTRASEAEMEWLANRAYAEYRYDKFKTKHGLLFGAHLEWFYRPPYLLALRLLDGLFLSPPRDDRAGKAKTQAQKDAGGLSRFAAAVRDLLTLPVKGRYDRYWNLQVKGSSNRSDEKGVVEIEFLGLWDTVGAYGLPMEEFRVAIDNWIFPLTFADQKPLPFVKTIRHALAIDEERDAFTPIAFHDAELRVAARGASGDASKKAAENAQSCVQLWFAGVHANVGGGYPDDSLAFEPLRWMLEQAIKCEAICVRDGVLDDIRSKATPFGQLYDSRAGVGGLYRYKPRDLIEALKPQGVALTDDYRPLVHESVVRRAAERFDGYAPLALPPVVLVADDDGRVVHRLELAKDRATRRQSVSGGAAIDEALRKVNPPTDEQRRLVDAAVFWRRTMYHPTIWSVILLVLMPLLDHSEPNENSGIAALFSFVGGFLPGFAEPWIATYSVYPWIAATLAVVGLISFWWGGRLKTLIGDRARAAWDTANRAPDPATGKIDENVELPQSWAAVFWDGLATKILRNDRLNASWDKIVLGSIPAAVAILVVFGVFPALIDRLVYQIRSFTGDVCVASEDAKPLDKSPVSRTVDIRNPCAPIGARLEAGQYYRLAVRIVPTDEQRAKNEPAAWRDASHPADLSGLKWKDISIPYQMLYLSWAPSFRRIFTQPWFKQMIRVGETGFAELPVEPNVPFKAGEPRASLAMTFRAPASGELFFFVNDAYTGVFPVGNFAGAPDGWTRNTYFNNVGAAQVSVAPASELEILALKGRLGNAE